MRNLRPTLTLVLIALFLPPSARAERDQDEDILDQKYKHGDYGFYISGHDPWDFQFDERSFSENDKGSLAHPVGFKMRFRLPKSILLEGDISYYHRGEEIAPFLSTLAAPKFDGLMVAATAQKMLRKRGMIRPYAGGGPVFVSLSRDFVIAVPGPDSTSADRFHLGGWTELDIGLQAVAGAEFRLGKRMYPFVEYRHLLGELGIEKVSVGGFDYSPSEVSVPRRDGSFAPVPEKYDYSGPVVMIGLKIHF
jgi:opacity protein-like surface antigen